MDPFLGEIILFAGNFAPRGWALCEGQILPINANQALFSLFGTIYGGDGRTSFALPDLRGRAPVSQGDGPGLSSYDLGQRGGSAKNTLVTQNLPAHNHNVLIPVSIDVAGESTGFLAAANSYAETSTANTFYPSSTSASTGSGQQVNNEQPYLALNYIVAITGTFPSRN